MTSRPDSDDMTLDDLSVDQLELTRWKLPLSQELCDRITHQAVNFQDQRNQLCQQALQQWLSQTLQCQAFPWPQSFEQISPFVNGLALQLGRCRLVVIPVDSIDVDEIRIAQEWVDIPSWRGDYYIMVQYRPNPDQPPTLTLLGYSTHRLLKQDADYDAFDRTYNIDPYELLSWDAFAPTYQLYSPAETQAEAAVAPLAKLGSAQAEQLIQRLSQPQELMPRLEVPFAQWGALLESPQWHQQLYQRRYGQTGKTSSQAGFNPVTRLAAWLEAANQSVQQAFTEGAAIAVRGEQSALNNEPTSTSVNRFTWQPLEAILTPQQVQAFQAKRGVQDIVYRAKHLSGNETGDELLGCLFLIGLRLLRDSPEDLASGKVQIILQLIPPPAPREALEQEDHPEPNPVLEAKQGLEQPSALRMRLLDEAGNEVGRANASDREQIQMRFRGSPGEAFSVEIAGTNQAITESFVL